MPFTFRVGFGTDIGRKRQQNQDNGCAEPELGLFVVADGMGGHRGGETASAMAVEEIPKYVRGQLRNDGWLPRDVIVGAVRAANRAIHERATKQPQLQGMGTTTTALLFAPDSRSSDGSGAILTIGHVGDSRCYYFRPGAVWQVTRDHSLVQEKLRAGLITREQLKTDRMKNVITRSVGFERDVNVEVYEMTVQPGDVFLICSDGLSGLIDDSKMMELVQKGVVEQGDVEATCARLIESANQAGGDDNITCVVIQVVPKGNA